MLLSFRSRLFVTLGAEHAQIQVERARRQPVADGKVLPAQKNESPFPWGPSLAAWRGYMTEAALTGANVNVIVADCFARYALVPWPGQILGRDELEALVRIQLENLYGEAVCTWACRYDMRRYGEAGIACAIDSALVEAIEELCADTGCKLASLQPQFMHSFNAASLPEQGSALFAFSDEASCTLASRGDHGWRSIRSVRHQRAQLRQVLERERLLQGLPADAPIYVAGLPASSAGDVRGIAACTVLKEGMRPDDAGITREAA